MEIEEAMSHIKATGRELIAMSLLPRDLATYLAVEVGHKVQPLMRHDVEHWMDVAREVKRRLANGYEEALPPTPTEVETDWGYTDLRNAARFVEDAGGDLRYCDAWNKWLVWDGGRWGVDATREVWRKAEATVVRLYKDVEGVDGGEQRKKLLKALMKCEARGRVEAMVALARGKRGVPVEAEELDCNPWLLNVEGGTLELSSATLREPRREEYLTKRTPVSYHAGARSELWNNFLEKATGGDAELEGFLQRAVGYSLTGDASEEVLFFLHGPAATGKSTFLEAVRATMGEYALMADFSTFIQKHYGEGGARPDVARLVGARFVVSVEVEEGKKLAEGLVKVLTGGDTVSVRRLYESSFEFRPQFKLWLAANTRPAVRASDDAMWRRILQIPFTVEIPEADRDPQLKYRLKSEAGEAILAWAVEGCMEWARVGLQVPEVVRRYTAEYQRENDTVARWLLECCSLGVGWSASRDLWMSYLTWAQEEGERDTATQRELRASLKSVGCVARMDRHRRGWSGILINNIPTLLEGESVKSDEKEGKNTQMEQQTQQTQHFHKLSSIAPRVKGLYGNAVFTVPTVSPPKYPYLDPRNGVWWVVWSEGHISPFNTREEAEAAIATHKPRQTAPEPPEGDRKTY